MCVRALGTPVMCLFTTISMYVSFRNKKNIYTSECICLYKIPKILYKKRTNEQIG